MANYWEPVEAEWQSRFGSQLSELSELVSDTHQLVADLAQNPELVEASVTESLFVERLLLRRLGEELRGVELLASRGHGFQAVSAAANLFEQSHFLTYVSADATTATEFLKWTDLHYTQDTVKNVVTKSGQLRSWNPQRIDDEYAKYRQLCGFKHNNPRYQVFLKLAGDPDIFLCRLALADSIWFMLTAIGMLSASRLSHESLQLFIERCNSLMDRSSELFPEFPPDEPKTESVCNPFRHRVALQGRLTDRGC